MQHHLHLYQHLATITKEAATACNDCSGDNDEMKKLARQLRSLTPEYRGGTKDLAHAVAVKAAEIRVKVGDEGTLAQWQIANAAHLLALAWSVVFAHGDENVQEALEKLDEARDYLAEYRRDYFRDARELRRR